ncbi:MAG: vitamin K epoxide reductase [Planctomyces sp.]|nr:vitamin K epoxide reductase [Planctomyces sp.]
MVAEEESVIEDSLLHQMDAIPQPWDYNPSAWDQRIPICILAMIAFFIASYMGLYQWRLVDSAWDPIFGDQTEKVLDSGVSEKMRRWFLVPDAIFGAVAYLGDAIFGLAGSTRRWQYRPWMVIVFGIDVIPLGIVSVVLVVLQGTIVGSWCFLCLVTAVISLILVYMAYDEVWSCLLYLRKVWKETKSKKIMWKTFWGLRTSEADRVAEEFIRMPKESPKRKSTPSK